MMKNILFYLSAICIAVLFDGCVWAPPPYGYEGWRKKDDSILYNTFRTETQKKLDEIEIQKAFLECGCENPLGCGNISDSQYATAIKCMEKAGFMSKSNVYSSGKTFCQDYPNLPACNLPLSQIPDRNISMRLNSKWCTKLYPQADACQP